jgi:ATP-dependent helicase Lhr and Lhr-like helicase
MSPTASPATASDPALSLFHPVIREWFAEEVGTPTDVQRRAWPEIAAGRHVLATAPTGTGKTLTAFLWALHRFFSGATETGFTRVLYVSPLKALNSDVRRNLQEPLAALTRRFEEAGLPVPSVRALTRSGDTSSSERQKMIRRPPEILITTPESLNILLTSQGGRSLLTGLETVILDEIHAVAGGKRGTHLLTAVERLVPLSGELQRIALSATVRPLVTVAEMVGGLRTIELPASPGGPGGQSEPGGWRYEKRPVTIVRSEAEKVYDLTVRFPGNPDPSAVLPEEAEERSIWDLVVPEIRKIVRRNRSTLVFANSRRTTEKLTRMINHPPTADATGEEDTAGDLAYSHHGSLSREVRQVVEERLKRGELPAIVATSSLELGIDVGAVGEVVLVQTPFSVASAVQRIGRAGHRVGEVSKGTLFPLHGRDFLEAAVVARAVREREIEALRPPENPLDVLAQVVLSMVVAEPWDLEALFAAVRGMWPYRSLPRRHFDLVLEMLAGRYADSRIRELAPRITVDRVEGTVKARRGAERLLYMSGGTIPDRGYYHLRTEDGARLGELDEEFVWERSVGDTFTLGTRIWRVRRITHNDVVVEPAYASAAMAPFWRADERDRDFFLSDKVGRFLEEVESRLEGEDAQLLAELGEELSLDRGAAAELIRLLRSQKAAHGGRLPHRHRVVVEHVRPEGGSEATGAASRTEGPDRRQVILHTFWGGRVNRPLAIALSAAWEERYGARPEILQDDDCLMLTLPEDLTREDALALVSPERIDELLRRRLEQTGFFGALFRHAASRALLLPRAGFRHRMPLWVTRQRSKRLLEAVGRYGDFPVVLETWRACLEDELDVESLKRLLEEVRAGEIEVRHVATDTPSPFAAHLVWKHTNTLMYATDSPEAEGAGKNPALRRDLLRELVFSSRLRPRLSRALVGELDAKLQRTAPGYAPRGRDELLDWLRERLLVPEDEWLALMAAVERDARAAADPPDLDLDLAREGRAVVVRPPGAEVASVVALESLGRVEGALGELVLSSLADPERPLEGGALRTVRENLERLAARPATAAEGEAGGEAADAEPLTELLGEWLRFYGPVGRERLDRVFGAGSNTEDGARGAAFEQALEDLAEEQRVVIDELFAPEEGVAGPQVCDTVNLETLLRWTRAAARPTFEALPLARLPLFLASHQGLVPPGHDLEGFQDRLEGLFALPLPARAWETEILPARMELYRKAWLDTLMRESELVWTGAGKGKVAFLFPADLELLRDEQAETEDDDEASSLRLDDLFPDRRGRFSLDDLADHSGAPAGEVAARLWELAWEGRVSNDAWETVRRAVLARFRVDPGAGAGASAPRSMRRAPRRGGAFDRWKAARPADGRWFVLPEPPGADPGEADGQAPAGLDALEREELAKDRARVVLARYGVVFRELLAREAAPFQWGRLFRALRIMELSGEVLAGQFFLGVPGLQFATPTAFRRLRDEIPPDAAVWWVDALDPASPCGLRLPGLAEGGGPRDETEPALPERRAGNHVVFEGERVVVVSRRRGASLEIRAGADHPRLGEYLGFLKTALTRDVVPRKLVEVEEINGVPAPESPYRERLRELFSATVEPGSVKLRRRY